jgi:hypothetical protein
VLGGGIRDKIPAAIEHTLLIQTYKKYTMPFDIEKCARPNILALEPYRCARESVFISNLSNNEKSKHGP